MNCKGNANHKLTYTDLKEGMVLIKEHTSMASQKIHTKPIHRQTSNKLFSPYWFQTYSDNNQLKAHTLKSISLAMSRTGVKAEPVITGWHFVCRCLMLYTDNSTFRVPNSVTHKL